MLGQFISKGQSREVYYLRDDKNYIVKKELKPHIRHNRKEYFSYLKLVKMNQAHWVAPCFLVGAFLIMPYCKKPEKFPKLVPNFLKDTHKKNFGILDDKFVCFDYPVLNDLKEFELVRPLWVKN